MDAYHTTHDWHGDASLSRTVVEAVATVGGKQATDVASLNAAIDADALESLFEPRDGSGRRNEAGRVSFAYDGCRVEVTSAGDVTVRRLAADGASDAVRDEADFQRALERLVGEAATNGVALEGGWACPGASDPREWGIEIYGVDGAD